ncbi:hypothetical protein QRD89_04300 [Halobacillus sp. ACCC02827]|uniref:hypothetical protein n=1 Tax=Bacillaceae TaxID=186817 RepID=UPI0002A4E2AB|nr:MULTISPECIES: hypothetical protein [Bacillaceae]ELK48884.1 hypothetical protein D479_01275 [Halobacillus sp. BAB-2008]QHT45786.1 hypothetical protein M662_04430 [Bacillus sp. SB49]WJE16588.1 hypothetical protein QRD89_04300 [Halobacillus sp. ACCC02827]
MSKRFTHLFNIIVGLLLLTEGSVYIFMNNKDGDIHVRSIIVTLILLAAWGVSYRNQTKKEDPSSWLIFTMIIMIPMILPWLFFI